MKVLPARVARIVFASALLTGCFPARPSFGPSLRVYDADDPGLDLRQHAVFVNRSGNPLRAPVVVEHGQPKLGTIRGDDVMGPREYGAYLHEMMDSVRAHPERPILLFAHGGLTTLNGSRKNNLAVRKEIIEDGYYPIFINWHSAMMATLGEHLLWVRQGQRQPWGPLTTPVPIVEDLLSAVGKIPVTFYAQLSDGVAPVTNPHPLHQQTYDSLRVRFGRPREISVSRGETRLQPSLARVPGAALFPLRVAEAPLVAGFGGPTWENMLRRIHLLFRAEGEMDQAHAMSQAGQTSYLEPSGAVSTLMDSIAGVLRRHPERSIVLIGHSMGAIIMNELLQRYPDLRVSDIVYMAAACSVRDLETSVIPYMQAHDRTRFYVLTLHERADQREKPWGTDFLPGGSLLEWLDDYLTTPRTSLDRRLGKWQNVIEHHYVFPPEIRDRVYVKGFGILDETVMPYRNKPTRHGHFNDPDVPFWRREFWTPVPPGGLRTAPRP